MKKLLKRNNIDILLVIWIYIEFIYLLTGFLLPGFYNALLKYFILSLLVLISVINCNFYISKKLLYFLIVYLAVLLLNVLLVNYRYYVIVDGLTSLIIMIPAFFIISSNKFNIEEFLSKWNKFSHINVFLIIIAFILYYLRISSYNIFAAIILPNLLIQCYSYFKKKEKKIIFIYIFAEILLLVLFGGRVAALISCIILIYSIIFFRETTIKKKMLILSIVIFIGIVILINLKNIVFGIDFILRYLGIYSRNLYLLTKQFNAGDFWNNFYLSKRDIIYTEVFNYLKNNWLFPNGFGLTRFITNGSYYHAHNLILQLLLILGLPCSLIFLIIFIVCFKKRISKEKKYADFFIFLLIFYFIRSIFDTYFLTNYISIMLLAFVFFYKEKEFVNFKIVFMRFVNSILWYLPNKAFAHKILYFLRTRKILNLDNPKTFDDKIQYLIVYHNGEKEANLADKYKAREYIEKAGYKNLLPKLYAVYNSVNEIDISKLPDTFVLKSNNASGYIFICTDKATFDFKLAKRELNSVLHQNFGKRSLEYHYSLIKPMIICEEYIGDINCLPVDYKFYCFDGYVDSLLLCTNRETKLTLDYYDLNWKYLNYAKEEFRSKKKNKKPKNFDKMVEIASKLSKGFPFVRVDLYNCDGKIYIGELTFTPLSGIIKTITKEAQEYYGNLVNISKVKKNE